MAHICVDFDGTLCLGLDFNIENKKPNKELIEKINYLHKNGNHIKIVTARGAFNSSLAERTQKYYDLIKNYLDKNGVLYDEISFNKEFADIYIDDLAIRPDEVVIAKDLSSSFTKNIVTRINDTVIKSGDSITNEREWYDAYKDKEDIPEILNLTRHSIVYKYIDPYGTFDTNEIICKVRKYATYPKLNSLKFNSYITGISMHLHANSGITNGQRLLNLLQLIDIKPTFAHGDLSIENIIPTQTGIKFIDPLYNADKFGSFILDYAKLLFSLKYYVEDYANFYLLCNNLAEYPHLNILIASECVRVASYKPQFSFIAENLINEL